jgi:hypothetical protein
MSQDFTGESPITDPNRFIYSGPGGPHQCNPYPHWVFHPTEPPRLVSSEQERQALDDSWSDTYIKRDYPKAKFNHETGEYRAVENPEEEGKLEGTWSDTPPEKPPRQTPSGLGDRTLQQVGEAVRDYRRLSLDYVALNQDLDTKADNVAMQPLRTADVPRPQYHQAETPEQIRKREHEQDEARRRHAEEEKKDNSGKKK